MPDYTNLLNVMKQAGVNANESQKPVKVCFGKVISESPLKIQIEQKITLTKVQLVLTKTVETLQKSDEVILLRVQGGQKYIVMDKVV